MKKTLFLFSLVIMLLLSSCATDKVRHKDYKRGPTPYSMDSVLIFNDGTYSIYLKKFTYPDKAFFSFNIIYAGTGWLNLTGKVDIHADENTITICDNSPERKILYSTHVKETILATINNEDLKKITNCSNLKMQFEEHPITINKKGIDKIKQFYATFVN
jgi:hypothetical protein